MMRLFQELQSYVGFGPEDERILPGLHPLLAPHYDQVIEAFYDRILEHEDARAALTRGERHVGHLKVSLKRWLEELFTGPWDEAYVQRRSRIGRVHVQINLSQHYMVSAMHVVRVMMRDHLNAHLDPRSPEGRNGLNAMQRIMDIDLALMLHTYREDLESKNARAERLATFGQLVGSIGHELRNPLGVIETSVYVLKSRPGEDPRTQKHLDRIGQQVLLANDIITQLLDLIRERPLSIQQVRLGRLLGDVAQTASTPTGVTLHLQGEGEAWVVDGDPTQLRQVISNLIDNAIHAASPVGSVRAVVARPDDAHLTLTVDDTGPGIDASIRNRLFEPLVTTKPKGIGLGLALVRRIVERHSGTIEVSRGPLGGARFFVELPVVNTQD